MSWSILRSPLVGLVETLFVHLFFLAARQDASMRWFGKETRGPRGIGGCRRGSALLGRELERGVLVRIYNPERRASAVASKDLKVIVRFSGGTRGMWGAQIEAREG